MLLPAMTEADAFVMQNKISDAHDSLKNTKDDIDQRGALPSRTH
jgi:hypothetical protein